MEFDQSNGDTREEFKKQKSHEDIAEIMYKERADSITEVVKRHDQNDDQ